MKKISEKGREVIAIVAFLFVLLLAGAVGNLDHDEYIEANSTPITRMP